MASLGVTVEPRTKVKPSPQGGVRYKIVDGTTTLRHPLKGRLVTVGNLGLEQPATGRDLNFTDFTIRLTPSKSVLIARSGSNIGYGGPRQTLLRIAPPPESVVVKGAGLELRSVPVTLTAAGVTAMNQQFGGGLAAPPFALDQAVATLTVKTRWYTPGATRGRS